MVLLTQEHFVSTIDAIRMQLHKDYAYADAVSSLFNTDSIGPYDNSLLVKQLISLLQMYFPRDKEGFCDIEHYCFELNFGKCGEQELITAEDLYRRLIDKTVNHYVETFKKVFADELIYRLNRFLNFNLKKAHSDIEKCKEEGHNMDSAAISFRRGRESIIEDLNLLITEMVNGNRKNQITQS